MPVITTNRTANGAFADPSTLGKHNFPKPPSAALQAELDINDDSDDPTLPPVEQQDTPSATPAKRKPAIQLDKLTPEEQAKREALMAQLQELNAKAKASKPKKSPQTEEAIARQKEVADKLKAEKAAKKEAEKAAVIKAKADAEAALKASIHPVDLAPIPASQLKQLDGKASVALKAAFSAENNSELGYKQLGARYNWGIKDLVTDLTAEGVWPTKEDGQPWSYKKLYELEKELGTKSWGHMVNRASERFTMLNPANIEKREAAQAEAKAKAEEEKQLVAAGLLDKATVTSKTKGVSVKSLDIASLTMPELIILGKTVLLAMDAETIKAFLEDEDIKLAIA